MLILRYWLLNFLIYIFYLIYFKLILFINFLIF